VHFTDLVVDAGVKQDALGRRGFARVDVRHDPDVAGLGEVKRCFGSHLLSRLFVLFCRLIKLGLPAVMCEGLVAFSHLVGVFTLLNCST